MAASGDRVIVGANAVDRGGVADVGAAYIYRREGAGWTIEATLQPEPSTVPIFFGWGVAIDGDTAIVGALGDAAGGFVNRGGAYVFVRTGTTWSQQAKLVMPDGRANDEAGVSVAIQGNTVVVGAPYHDTTAASDAGAVWVFVRSGSTWNLQAKVIAPETTNPVPNFGRSVALDGDTLVVGSARHPVVVFPTDDSIRGAAHLFVRQAGAWTSQARLVPEGPDYCNIADFFGTSVAVEGHVVVVGSPSDCVVMRPGVWPEIGGAARVFARVDGAWSQRAWLFHDQEATARGEQRGASVAIKNGIVAVGSPHTRGGFNDPSTVEWGQVTLYAQPGNIWTEVTSILAADREARDHFGSSVAMAGGFLFASVPDDDVGPAADRGSVRALELAKLIDNDEDGLLDVWERQFGLDPLSAAGINGGTGDPDGDGRTNLEEYQGGTHPRNVAALTRYLAEGASTSFFDTRIALANAGNAPATVLLRFLKADGSAFTQFVHLAAEGRTALLVDAIPAMANAEFSTVIETDSLVVVDRTMWWDSGTAYGTHAETAVDGPATTWYLAEGATHSGFNLFYLVQNPTATEASLQVTYLLPSPAAPVVRSYAIAANSRFNIWVNQQGAALASTDVSAVLTSTNAVPVIVERAMYLNTGGLLFGAGHESTGIRAPATDWYLAEGATGPYFDLFVLIANPGTVDANVQARYLLPNGTTITKGYTVPARSRFNVWVDLQDAALANTAVSTIVTSTNSVPIIVERAMWWPGPQATTWHEAHNSAGATTPGTRWAMAEGEVGGPASTQTFVLIANTSPTPGTVRVRLLNCSGNNCSRTYEVLGNSRFNVDMEPEFPLIRGFQFSVVVESIGPSPIPIVVERAMYSNARGVTWAAGTNALATRLQ